MENCDKNNRCDILVASYAQMNSALSTLIYSMSSNEPSQETLTQVKFLSTINRLALCDCSYNTSTYEDICNCNFDGGIF